jgi:hypothetical protein
MKAGETKVTLYLPVQLLVMPAAADSSMVVVVEPLVAAVVVILAMAAATVVLAETHHSTVIILAVAVVLVDIQVAAVTGHQDMRPTVQLAEVMVVVQAVVQLVMLVEVEVAQVYWVKVPVQQQDRHKVAAVMADQAAQLANPAAEFTIMMGMLAVPVVLMVVAAAVPLTVVEDEDLSVLMEQSELYGVQDVHSHQQTPVMYKKGKQNARTTLY